MNRSALKEGKTLSRESLLAQTVVKPPQFFPRRLEVLGDFRVNFCLDVLVSASHAYVSANLGNTLHRARPKAMR